MWGKDGDIGKLDKKNRTGKNAFFNNMFNFS